MSVHQLLAAAAQACPGGIAIHHRGHAVTWDELRARVAQRAASLRAYGLQPGARVAVLAGNMPEHLEVQHAVAWAGLILVPLNTRLSLDEQQYILEHCECDCLCHDESHAGSARELAGRVGGLRTVQLGPVDAWRGADDALAGMPELPYAPARPTDAAAIFYTGGTTGVPKGVELSHTALLLQGLAAKDNYRFDETTVFMHTAPMFHLADFAASLGATAACATHCFLPDFTPEALLDAIDREGVNVVILVPTMIARVLDAAQERAGTLGKLRKILYGAAPIQEPLLRRLLEEAPGIGLVQVYGQTELGGACTVLLPEYHVLEGRHGGKLDSAGRCIPAFTLRIADEGGRKCPTGVTGEIQVSGPGVMTSYWNDPQLTAATLQDGWLKTGDLGVLDEDGFVSIVGRLKDMIITGGENVFAGEVESALMYHPAVEAAAVIGVPDAKWGEAVHAVVVLKQGRSAQAEELITHCRERIAHYKCPRTIAIRHGSLPLSGVGKVRKIDLLNEWKQVRQERVSQ